MKIVLLGFIVIFPLSLVSEEPKHPFFEDTLAKDDFIFRVSTVPEIHFVRDRDNDILTTVFILHIRAGVSAVTVPRDKAFEVSLFKDGQKYALCQVSYTCPTPAEKRGGDIVFQKDRITRLRISIECHSKKFLPGKYTVKFDTIRTRYDNTEKLFIPKAGQKGFESEPIVIGE